MVTETKGKAGDSLFDEAAKSRVRGVLRHMDLPSSVTYLPEEGKAEGLEYSSQQHFANDPEVLEAERNDALEEIQNDLAGLSPVPAEIAAKITALSSAHSVLQIRQLKVDIQKDIQKAIEDRDLENNLDSPTPEMKLKAMWASFETCEKEIQDAFEELYKQGKITRAQMKYLRDERTRLDALPKESDARIQGEKALAEYQKEIGIAVREEANVQGDEHTAQSADKVVTLAEEQDKRLEEMRELAMKWNQPNEELKGAEVTKEKKNTANAGFESIPDEPLKKAPSSSWEKQRLAFTDANPNDVEAPIGGKDRTATRKITKA